MSLLQSLSFLSILSILVCCTSGLQVVSDMKRVRVVPSSAPSASSLSSLSSLSLASTSTSPLKNKFALSRTPSPSSYSVWNKNRSMMTCLHVTSSEDNELILAELDKLTKEFVDVQCEFLSINVFLFVVRLIDSIHSPMLTHTLAYYHTANTIYQQQQFRKIVKCTKNN